MEIRVLSINTWKCDGHYRKRIEVMREQILPLNVDFLACQEVFQTLDESYSTVNYLANALNLQPIWFPSRLKNRTIENQSLASFSGLCLFTRYEPAEVHSLFLPDDPRDGERTAQCIVFELNNQRVLLVNTHLTHLKNAQNLRLRQMQYIVEKIKQIKDLEGYIICGDLNTDPDSATIHYLLHTLARSTNIFSDLVPSTHISGKVLDYIFYSDINRLKLTSATIALDRPVNKLFPSDHFGVIADFKLGNH